MRVSLVVMLTVAVAIAGSVATPGRLNASACSQLWAASSGYCCDPDGSWDRCPGQPNNCPTKAATGGGIFVQVLGDVCNPDGASCQEASPGPYDAECEGSWFNVDCWYGQNPANCNDLRSSTCDTDVVVISYPESPMTTMIYSCECPGGNVIGMVSNRKTCFGDSCSW